MSQRTIDALAAATRFLERSRLATGELPVCATSDPTLATKAALDPAIYPRARALAGRSGEGHALLSRKLRRSEPQNALHLALQLCAKSFLFQQSQDEEVERLLALQMPDPRWGSEALTTVFAAEALARFLKLEIQ